MSNFPTVRAQIARDGDVSMLLTEGAWYYEVVLLTDGLMQIGWADEAFQCDPLSGQGVGDNEHSWAYDGFRSKKWNGALGCELR